MEQPQSLSFPQYNDGVITHSLLTWMSTTSKGKLHLQEEVMVCDFVQRFSSPLSAIAITNCIFCFPETQRMMEKLVEQGLGGPMSLPQVGQG